MCGAELAATLREQFEEAGRLVREAGRRRNRARGTVTDEPAADAPAATEAAAALPVTWESGWASPRASRNQPGPPDLRPVDGAESHHLGDGARSPPAFPTKTRSLDTIGAAVMNSPLAGP
jgi:hypothetical protein